VAVFGLSAESARETTALGIANSIQVFRGVSFDSSAFGV